MTWLGILLALGTSTSWAAANVLTRRLGRSVGPARGMIWSMTAGALLAAPIACVFDDRSAPWTATITAWVVIAALSGVVAYVGLFFALAGESLTLAVPLVSSWSVVAGVISVAIFGERIRTVQLIGAAGVVAGVILVGLGSGPPRDVHAPSSAGAPSVTSQRALGAAAASALGFGVMIPAMGRIAPATGVFGAMAVVAAIAVPLAAGLARLAHQPMRPPERSAWGIVVSTGAAETIGFVCVTLARRFAPMTLVAPVASLAATLTVLYAWALLRERPRPLAIAGALVAGAGVVVIAA
jgi:drug/metabolite transporter (DMT)-like permease